MTTWSFHLEEHGWSRERKLYITSHGRSFGERLLVAPLLLVEIDTGAPVDVPTLRETMEDRQDNRGDVTDFLQGALAAAAGVPDQVRSEPSAVELGAAVRRAGLAGE